MMFDQGDVGSKGPRLFKGQDGAMGYGIAWLLGVPVSVLFVVFLLRGCN